MNFEESVIIAIKELEDTHKSEVKCSKFTIKKLDKEKYLLVQNERSLMTPMSRFLIQNSTKSGIEITLPSLDDCESMMMNFDDDSKNSLAHLKTYSSSELLYKLGVGILLQQAK